MACSTHLSQGVSGNLNGVNLSTLERKKIFVLHFKVQGQFIVKRTKHMVVQNQSAPFQEVRRSMSHWEQNSCTEPLTVVRAQAHEGAWGPTVPEDRKLCFPVCLAN